MELGTTQPTNIRNTRSLICTLKYVLDILQTEEAFTVKEYKHTRTHTHAHTHTHTHTHISVLLKNTDFTNSNSNYKGFVHFKII